MLKRLEQIRDFEIAEGSPDIRGWDVFDRTHQHVGKVDSLLIDPETAEASGMTPVRYLSLATDGHTRMVPIGQVDISETQHEVHLKQSALADVDRFPEFEAGEVTPERERRYFTSFFPEEREPNYERPEFRHESKLLRLIEERLNVGKRGQQIGEAVARKRVEEKPVEETIELRREEVEVERRAVNKPLSETDYATTGGRAFETEKEIRMPLMGEEAVVEKQPYVKEEVVLKKDTKTESKTIRETVRSEELEFAGTEPEERLEDAELRKRTRRTEGVTEEEPSMADKLKRKLGMD